MLSSSGRRCSLTHPKARRRRHRRGHGHTEPCGSVCNTRIYRLQEERRLTQLTPFARPAPPRSGRGLPELLLRDDVHGAVGRHGHGTIPEERRARDPEPRTWAPPGSDPCCATCNVTLPKGQIAKVPPGTHLPHVKTGRCMARISCSASSVSCSDETDSEPEPPETGPEKEKSWESSRARLRSSRVEQAVWR